jgi:Fe2+ transport system protein B
VFLETLNVTELLKHIRLSKVGTDSAKQTFRVMQQHAKCINKIMQQCLAQSPQHSPTATQERRARLIAHTAAATALLQMQLYLLLTATFAAVCRSSSDV